MTLRQPHNNFFEQSFGRVEVVKGYLEAYLPPEISQLLNLDSLHREDSKFVDDSLRDHQSDILYRVTLKTGEMVNIYFLWEHKSYIDPMVGLQLLRYMVRIWERDTMEKHPILPIFPIVVYHGEKEWRISTQFTDLFTTLPDEFKPYMPTFNYHLSDFSHLSDEEIQGNIWIQVCTTVLKAIFDPNLRDILPELMSLIFELRKQQTGLEYIRTILYYFTRGTERLTYEQLKVVFQSQDVIGEDVMATIAQELEEKGRMEGIKIGRQEAILDLAKRLLELHNIPTVSELTGLSIEEVQVLKEEIDNLSTPSI